MSHFGDVVRWLRAAGGNARHVFGIRVSTCHGGQWAATPRPRVGRGWPPDLRAGVEGAEKGMLCWRAARLHAAAFIFQPPRWIPRAPTGGRDGRGDTRTGRAHGPSLLPPAAVDPPSPAPLPASTPPPTPPPPVAPPGNQGVRGDAHCGGGGGADRAAGGGHRAHSPPTSRPPFGGRAAQRWRQRPVARRVGERGAGRRSAAARSRPPRRRWS